MFIRMKNMPSGKTAIQIVSSVRVGDKVQQKILRHVGTAANDIEVKLIHNLALKFKNEMEKDLQPTLFDQEELVDSIISSKASQKDDSKLDVDLGEVKEESRVIIGIHEVYSKIYQEIGFDRALPNPARKVA